MAAPRFFSPRQVPGGRWFYTLREGERVRKVGLCATSECVGHGTEEAAREHFREYLLTARLDLNYRTFKTRPCAVCLLFTDMAADVDRTWIFPLCDDHRRPAAVDALMRDPGIMIFPLDGGMVAD